MKKLFLLLTLTLVGCGAGTSTPVAPTPVTVTEAIAVNTLVSTSAFPAFELTSPSFQNEQSIPLEFSCKGNNSNPALTWTEPPAGTQSFALIMDDPDAPSGTWVHWVIFNIPASSRGLSAGTPTNANLSDGSVQGITSAGSHGYHGPCPPSGTHRYFFKLYTLDTVLSLGSDATKDTLLAAMDGHVLGNVELMGTFSK